MTYIEESLNMANHALASNPSPGNSMAHAQVLATAAVVEQLRVSNVIALASLAGSDTVPEQLAEAAYGALDALVETKTEPNGHMDPHEHEVLRSDVARALGVKA